jgi:O-antigen ligase
MKPTYNYFKKAFLDFTNLIRNPEIFSYLLALILLAIPLKYAVGSVTIILFLAVSFSTLHGFKFVLNKAIVLLLGFYFLMALSLLWSIESSLTLKGLGKELPFLAIPMAFLWIPNLRSTNTKKVFELFSFGMVFYTIFYISNAIYRFYATGDKAVFFYHELVTKDVNAIYVSVFASFALFYFVSQNNQKRISKGAILLLTILVLLLSSKNIILVDFVLIIVYFLFFSGYDKIKKSRIILLIFCLLISAVLFLKQVRNRFKMEYETAFVTNSIHSDFGTQKGAVYTVSLKQAWNQEQFQPNNYFPGTALRLYQIRIFKEMMQEQKKSIATGFGFEATQDKIRAKAVEHNLFSGYGAFNFHNQYIQTFAELGIFGFLILIGMLYSNLKKAVIDKNFLHIAFAITMIMLFLTESFFCRQRGVVFFVLLYCLLNTVDTNKTNVSFK